MDHFAWVVAAEGEAWEEADVLKEGGLFDVPWPALVWDCRRYKDGDGGAAGGEADEQPDTRYAQIGYMFPHDRPKFRGLEQCKSILSDLMRAASTRDPSSCFVVFA